MTTPQTPLSRAAAVIEQRLRPEMHGFDNTQWQEFAYKLAGEVLDAAQLPEQLEIATELRTGNLINLADLMFRGGQHEAAELLSGQAIDRITPKATE